MEYFEQLINWIAGFLKEMLDNFRAVLTAFDNSKAAIDDAIKTFEENTEA